MEENLETGICFLFSFGSGVGFKVGESSRACFWVDYWLGVGHLSLSFPSFFGVVSTSYLWLRIVILVRVALCLGLCLLGVCVSWKCQSLSPDNTFLLMHG